MAIVPYPTEDVIDTSVDSIETPGAGEAAIFVNESGMIVVVDESGTPKELPTQTGYTVFPINFEENAALSNTNRQWSIGNGSVGAVNITVPECEVFAMSFASETAGTSVSIQLMRNDVVSTSTLFSGQNDYVGITPIQFNEGDTLGMQTDTVTGAYTDARVTAWCRVPLAGIKGADGSQGPAGSNGIPNQVARITLNPQSDINNAAPTNIQFNASTIDTIGVTVNPTSIGLPAGIYSAQLQISTNTTVARANQRLTLLLDSVIYSYNNGEGYIRVSAGHEEACISITEMFELASPGALSFTSEALAAAGIVNTDPAGSRLLITRIS